jgi:hypothetical protein
MASRLKSLAARHVRATDRSKTSLYLSKKLLEEFKKAIGTAPISKMIEELMRDALDEKRKETTP